jgi:hypothetical protein
MRYCGVACGQFRFSLRPQGVDRAFPGERPVTGAARQHDPQHFPNVRTGPAPFYTSDPHGYAQQSRAGRQRVSVPVLARGGRPAGRRSGLGHRPRRRAPDARRIPCRQAARVPRRLPAVTLIVILPAARPRYAHAARAQPPPTLPRPVPSRPRAGAGGAGPHRRPGSAADHRPRQRPMPGRWPAEASLHATARHPVMRARTPAGPARAWCRPRQDVPAGQNQARPLHV